MRLVDCLTELSQSSFELLCRKRRVIIDPQKKLAPVEQAQRQLASPRELTHAADLSPEVRRTLAMFAGAPDGVPRSELSGSLVQLVDAGLVFPVRKDPSRFVMPTAYRLQCPKAPSDDPKSMRVLVLTLDDESLHALVVHHLGRISTAPHFIVLGDLLDKLEARRIIEKELTNLAPRERQLLSAIEARGGEVDPAELLDLAGDARRYTTETRVAPISRRSPAFPLSRAGLLFASGREGYVIPTEVSAVLGKDRRTRAVETRRTVQERVASMDLTPTRAKFADDAGPLTVALLAALRADGVALESDTAAPRTSVVRAAKLLMVDVRVAELLVALARADSLFMSKATVRDVSGRLYRMWRKFGAWDEARTERDPLRARDNTARIPTPTSALAQVLLELLEEVPDTRFVLVSDLVTAVLADLRVSSAAQKLIRARKRHRDAFVASPETLVRTILDESLPALGVVDRGLSESLPVVRLSARARRALRVESAPALGDATPASFTSPSVLTLSWDALVAQVLALSDFGTVHSSGDTLVVSFEEETVTRGLLRGLDPVDLRERVKRMTNADLDAETARMLDSASAARIPCAYLPSSAFVVIADANLRRLLLEDEAAASFIVSDSPDGGVLLREGASFARVQRIIKRLGGELLRAKIP